MDVRFRRARETSPDRAKVCMQQPRVKVIMPIKRVQVVYYLTRNGQLEHPHYMEVTHLANQPLRLKDVMERLTALRGKGMPSLYSWSCKRSYKNGYVWNDLAENDIIYPADGAEYVLKGSELVDGCSERLQQIQVSNKQVIIHDPTNFQSKPKQIALNIQRSRREAAEITKYEEPQAFYEEEEQRQEEEEYYEDEEIKTSYTSSTTPHSRCSRGVSTDELEENHQETTQKIPTESSTQSDSSAPPLTSSILIHNNSNNTSKRFEDGDPVSTASSRNSVLLQLIACGNLAVSKAKNVPTGFNKQPMNDTNHNNNTNNNNNNVVIIKRSNNNLNDLHKGVLCKSAMNKKVVVEDDVMISCMSENPRFGNLQAEEKEYFSGSIVESISHEDRVVAEPAMLKKSNSYNEERGRKARLGEEVIETEEEEEKREKKAVLRGKCIPRKKSSSTSKQTKKMSQL